MAVRHSETRTGSKWKIKQTNEFSKRTFLCFKSKQKNLGQLKDAELLYFIVFFYICNYKYVCALTSLRFTYYIFRSCRIHSIQTIK